MKKFEKLEKNSESVHPRETKFTIEDAKLLVKGLYKHMDDDEEGALLEKFGPERDVEGD